MTRVDFAHYPLTVFDISSDVVSFFFNDTATTEIYTLSLHDALPISSRRRHTRLATDSTSNVCSSTSEEHTCELQSLPNRGCLLLLAIWRAQGGTPINYQIRLTPSPAT